MENTAALNRPSEVIYQIYPSSFQDSDGDGIGDLKGITQRLDYVKNLGVDAIWISPFFKSPEGKAADGGYAISDYRAIDPKFGTEQDFRELLAKAHNKGLRVYTDFVLCHTANEHEWFQKSRKREPGFEDFYVWHDGIPVWHEGKIVRHDPPNNWKSVFGGPAWSWDEERKQYYLRHFNSTQPALNLNLEKVRHAVMGDMRYWLDMGVDGLRLDALPFANHDPKLTSNPIIDGREGWSDPWAQQYFQHSMCQPSTINFVQEIREMLDSYGPEKSKIALGEVIAGRMGGHDSMQLAKEYLDPKTGLHTSYTQSLVQFYNQYPPADKVREMIANNINGSPDGGFCTNLGNHDFPRYATRMLDVPGKQIPYDVHQQIIKQMMMLAITLPGSFCMYQGEELGLPQAGEKDLRDYPKRDEVAIECRDGCRTPMPWVANARNAGFTESNTPYLPVPNSHRPLAVDVQKAQPESMLHFTQRLIEQRKENIALQRGKTTLLQTYGALVAFIREAEGQPVLCAFNMSGEKIKFTPSDLIDAQTLKLLNIEPGEELHLDEYGTSFHGLKQTRETEIGMRATGTLALNGNGHTVKRIFSADMLIADNHVTHATVSNALGLIEPGSRLTIDKDLHQRLLAETANAETPEIVTAGGATGSTMWMLKKLLGDNAEVTLLGLAGEGKYGKVIKEFLHNAGIIMLPDKWPADINPETTVSHIVAHGNGKHSILTYPGTEVEAVHKLLDQAAHSDLLEDSIHRSDIVYIPESIVEKFGMAFLDKMVGLRWKYNKELVLSLPSHANFGPSDSDKFKFLIPSCNVVIGNDVEFCRIMEGSGIDANTPREVTDEQVHKVAQQIQAEFQKEVLKAWGRPVSKHGQVAFITRGDKPALLVTKDAIKEIPIFSPEMPGATPNMLGAGYASTAAFLAGYVGGLNHEQSAHLAMGLATQKTLQQTPEPYVKDPRQALARLLNIRSLPPVSRAASDFFGLQHQQQDRREASPRGA